MKKDRAYVINLDEHKSVWTLFISSYVNGNSLKHFKSFGAENITTNIYKILPYD